MEAYLNNIAGIDDAIVSMYISKRSLTREKEIMIRNYADRFLTPRGSLNKNLNGIIVSEWDEDIERCMALKFKQTMDFDHFSKKVRDEYEEFQDMLNKVCNMGKHHITLLRFIDFSFMVYGLHRAGQDDWDAHTCRYNNRIIRSSTRLATFQDEKSDFYKEKILSTDQALKAISIDVPDEIVVDGKTYVKTTNGYILKEFKDDKDVKRGLYMLSIPSNFIFKVNLTEWAHVYKERRLGGAANPEVKQLAETIADLLNDAHPQFTRTLFEEIKN